MNCSTTAATTDIQNRYFFGGNFGASVFMATYIGFYGMGIILYFTIQFMTDSRDNHQDDISMGFFSTFHQITEREEIYNQLIDKNWVERIYKVYYSGEQVKSAIIEEKVNQCSNKYHQKIQNLKSRHTYYVTETSTPPPILTTVSSID